jgi:hypothetical protein
VCGDRAGSDVGPTGGSSPGRPYEPADVTYEAVRDYRAAAERIRQPLKRQPTFAAFA